jgi:hypothetical protein
MIFCAVSALPLETVLVSRTGDSADLEYWEVSEWVAPILLSEADLLQDG